RCERRGIVGAIRASARDQLKIECIRFCGEHIAAQINPLARGGRDDLGWPGRAGCGCDGPTIARCLCERRLDAFGNEHGGNRRDHHRGEEYFSQHHSASSVLTTIRTPGGAVIVTVIVTSSASGCSIPPMPPAHCARSSAGVPSNEFVSTSPVTPGQPCGPGPALWVCSPPRMPRAHCAGGGAGVPSNEFVSTSPVPPGHPCGPGPALPSEYCHSQK